MGLTSAQRHAARELGALLDGNPFTDAAFVLLAESGCTIRQWRERNSGIAHCSSPAWEITVPRPRTALSFGVFAHEVGHQMLHRSSSLPRYVEEVQAWEFALDAAKRLNVDETPHERVCRSLRFAFKKALRAGVSASRLYANDDVRWWAVEVDVYALAESLTATANRKEVRPMPPIAVTLPPREQIEKDAASLRSSCVRASLLGHFCDVAALERLIIAARLAPDLNELPALVAAEFHSAYANEEATTIEDCVLTVLSRRAA